MNEELERLLKHIFRLPAEEEKIPAIDGQMIEVAAFFLDFAKKYFRAEVHGLENIPLNEAALLVGNHNGGITTFEPFMLGLEWYYRHGAKQAIRFLSHDVICGLPLVGRFLSMTGAIRASHVCAEQALRDGEKVAVFPGGNYEAFRPYSQRNLVDFGGHVGYVRLALRARVPIIPVMCLGGHETLFVLKRSDTLAELTGVKRHFRSSFPIFWGLPWGLTFGPMFHFPLPAKLVIEVGAPISLERYYDSDSENKQLLEEISKEVQAVIQQMMDRRVAQRRWPIIG